MRTTPSSSVCSTAAQPYDEICACGLEQRDDAASEAGTDVEHAREAGGSPRVDQVVGRGSTAKGSRADVLGRRTRRRARSPRGSPWRTYGTVARVRRLADPGEPLVVALVLQRLLELERAVEVVLERALVASGDHEDVGEPRATASSTTYWIAGLSTTGSISLGWLSSRAGTGCRDRPPG
jgi:hypothetical protein